MTENTPVMPLFYAYDFIYETSSMNAVEMYHSVHILSLSVYGFMNHFLLKYGHKDRSGKRGANRELWPHSKAPLRCDQILYISHQQEPHQKGALT